jgi:hypothetical protein
MRAGRHIDRIPIETHDPPALQTCMVHVTLYFSALVVHDGYRDSKKHCATTSATQLRIRTPERGQGAGIHVLL